MTRMISTCIALRKAVFALVLGFLMTMMAQSAWAHHGWSDYDESKRATLTGTIRELHFGNPHASIVLETPTETWYVMLDSPLRLQNRAVTEEMLSVGKSITLEGVPHKSKKGAFRAERLMIGGKTIELR